MSEFNVLRNFGLNVVSVKHLLVDSKKGYSEEGESAYYQIGLIIGGEGNCLHNDRKICLTKGDIIFKKPYDKVFLPVSCESLVITFYAYTESGDILDFTKHLPQTILSHINLYPFNTSSKYHDYYIFFKESFNLFNHNVWTSNLAVQSNLFRILYSYFKDLLDLNAHRSLSKRDIYIVGQVKKYIHEHYTKNIKIDELSEFAGLSPSHLGRLFKKVENLAPLEYTIGLRLDYARQLLLTTDKSIKEISFSCGFENISYFCTLFKKKVGTTPQEYRMKGY